MAVSFVSRNQKLSTGSAPDAGAFTASAGDLIVRLVVAFSDSASITAPSEGGYTLLQSGNLSTYGNGPGKFAIYGKIAAGGETSATVGVSTGASVNVVYVFAGAHSTLASALSAFNFITGAAFADDSWPTVAGATASISKTGSAAVFGAWAKNNAITIETGGVGTFAPPNELETNGTQNSTGAVSSGYSTGLAIGTTTAYGVSGDPWGSGSSLAQRATFVLVVRPANTAPPAPAAIVSPANSSTWGATTSELLTLDGTAGTDPEGDTLQAEWQLSRDNGATWPYSTGLGALDRTWDISAVPGSTACKVRVRHHDGTVYGDWLTQSGTFTIEHDAAHSPPTPVSPINGTTVDRTSVSLRWQANPAVGGSGQSKADVSYRVVAGSWTTVAPAVVGAGDTYVIPSTLAAGDYEWQAQTYNALDQASGWSSSAFFTAGDVPNPPTITSHAVDDTIGTSTDLLEWTGTGTSVRVRILGDNAGVPDTGDIVYDSGTVTPGTTSHGLTFPDNGVTLHLQVRRTVGGLDSSYASVRVGVDYTPPASPVAAVTVHQVDGRDAALQITITN
jgi:hypothetical protein